MNFTELLEYLSKNPLVTLISILALSVIVFFIARFIIGKALVVLAERTATKMDDIIVKNLQPFRVAWLAPLLILYSFAYLLPDYQDIIEKTTLFFILWVSTYVINSLMNAGNEIYESAENYTGVSIKGYLDIVKLIVILIGLILTISLITGESPSVLLSGLGALTAILLLVFRDTILSLVASIQIASQDLVKEGDWIEVPSYAADGDVIDMSLHSIKVQNWDKTISVIPTYKMVDVAYKNWRGMQESGGRRIKRSIHIDLSSIQFCDKAFLSELKKIDFLKDQIEEITKAIASSGSNADINQTSILNGPQITNAEVFRKYIEAYLRNREDIYKVEEGMSFLIRALAPSPNGLPIELYVFTKTIVWDDYEQIQAQIFDHLVAAAPHFGLRLFQQPTGMDFAAVVRK